MSDEDVVRDDKDHPVTTQRDHPVTTQRDKPDPAQPDPGKNKIQIS